MAKRFTETDWWEEQWFRTLSQRHKNFWYYLNARCDQAGVWKVDFPLASFFIGETVTADDLLHFGDRVLKIAEDKIWLTEFIEFQYKTLSPDSPVHRPIIKLIERHNLPVEGTRFKKPKITVRPVDIQPALTLEDIGKQIFDEQLFVEQLKMLYPGRDLKRSFVECFLYFSEQKNPPVELSEWKRKFLTSLSIVKEKGNGKFTQQGKVDKLVDEFRNRHPEFFE